jgi:hypothetical protein
MADRDPGSLQEAFTVLRGHVEATRAPADLFQRIAQRAGGRRARGGHPRRLVWAAALAGALAVAGASFAWLRARPLELAGFEVIAASADLRTDVANGLLTVEAGQASLRLTDLAADVTVPGRARLRREPRGVRLEDGTAIFEVAHRQETPLTVYVSGGRIEVLGTRFTVVAEGDGGSVRLERGAIRFVEPAGGETLLQPGEELRWPVARAAAPPPLPVPSAAPPAPVEPAPRPPHKRPLAKAPPPAPPPAPPEVEPVPAPSPAEVAAQHERRVLAEIDRLRIRREDALLVSRLDEMLAEPVPEPLRERLSFERCDVLAHRAAEDRRACAEIARHLAAYPNGEYTVRLERSRRSLGCDP